MEFILKDTKIPLVRSLDAGAYFRDIADALVSIGYIRQKSLFGAPYDFRKGPSKPLIIFFLNIPKTDFDFSPSQTRTKNGL